MSSRLPTLHYIEDDPLFEEEFKAVAPPGWEYVWSEDIKSALGRLAAFERGDGLVLDMAFGGSRYQGIQVLHWAMANKEVLLHSVVIYTAWDDGETREALSPFPNIPIIGKGTPAAEVIHQLLARLRK